MANQQYLLSDMDFFSNCETSNIVISEQNIIKLEFDTCKGDIDNFINSMVDNMDYTVYCLKSPVEYLMYLIVSYVEYQQTAIRAGTSKSLIPQLTCYFTNHLGNVNKVYTS